MLDVWAAVHAERAELTAYLETLDEAQWERPSLCARWTVHDVVAHLVDVARTGRVAFLVDLARCRFDFDRQNARGVARERGASPRETLARLREVAHLTRTPPAPLATRLVEAIVHGEDVRRPLGGAGDYPLEAVEAALRHQLRTTTSFGGGREHAAGLRLRASDLDLDAGEGPAVGGPGLALLLALSGRRAGLVGLEGEGVARLRERLGG